MAEGTAKLAKVIHDRMQTSREAYSDLILDFGDIKDDYSLVTNTYPVSIPKSDYLVLRQLTLGETDDKLTKTQGGEKVLIPEKMRWIKPGDRVLVAWVQHDAIVLDKICQATEIG